jgi:exopolysaccharide production protein ExoZ
VARLRSIQVLRAVAATGVVVHHAMHPIAPDTYARIGAAGVDIFFVISGLIIATVAKRRTPTQFLVDRIWRIFPLWLLALAPWLILKKPDLPTLLSSLTLWPIYGNQFYTPSLGVGWSLCYEMLFYGAFALCLARWRRIPLPVFASCFFVGPLFESAVGSFLGSPLILEFLAGVAIARLPANNRLALPLLAAGVALMAIAPVDHYARILGPGTLTRAMWWGVPAALIVYGARGLEPFFDRREFDVPVLFGDASYSIYLFHPLVVNYGFVAGIAASLAFGTAVHVAVERPLLKFRSQRRPPPSVPEVEAAGLDSRGSRASLCGCSNPHSHCWPQYRPPQSPSR